MSGQNKSLEFKFISDPQSVQRIVTQFRTLTAEAQKFMAALRGGGGGSGAGFPGLVSPGGSPLGSLFGGGTVGAGTSVQQTLGRGGAGAGSFAAALQQNAQAMKGLAGTSRDTMQVMSDVVRRGISEQQRSLDSLDKTIAKLTQDYKALQGQAAAASAAGLGTEGFDRQLSGVGGQLLEARTQRGSVAGQKLEAEAQAAGLAAALAPPGPEAGPGTGARWDAFARPRGLPTWRNQQGNLFGRQGMMAATGAALAGGHALLQDYVQDPSRYTALAAREAQATKTMGLTTRQGDLRYAFALRRLAGGGEETELGDLRAIGGSETLRRLTGVGRGAWATLTSGGAVNALDIQRGIPTEMKEDMRRLLENKIASDPKFFSNLATFQSESGARVALMRQLGVSERGLLAAQKGLGEDADALPGLIGALRAGGRGFAWSQLNTALSAHRAGMGLGAVGALSEGFADPRLAPTLAGSAGIGMDVAVGERLAQGLGGLLGAAGMGPGAGAGLMGAMTSVGLGGLGSQDMAFAVQQRIAGMPATGRFLGGGDGLGTGIAALAANEVVGPNGDPNTKQALMQLMRDPTRLAEVMANNISPALRAQGVTSGLARSMFEKVTARNAGARFFATGNLSAGSKAMQEWTQTYGGDMRAYFSARTAGGARARDVLAEMGAGLQSAMPENFATPELAAEQVGVMLGMRNAAELMKTSGRDAAAGSAARAHARGSSVAGTELREEFLDADTTKALKAFSDPKVLRGIGDHFEQLGEMGKDAKAVADGMLDLRTALGELSVGVIKTTGTFAKLVGDKAMERRTAEALAEALDNQKANQRAHDAAHKTNHGNWRQQ